MFLSSGGGSSISLPINSAVGQGETKLIQAELGNNVNAGTYISGNANTIVDTLGTGNWKFYVSPSTSIASISAASDPSEWTGGSLLSYTDADYYMFYPFNTNTVSGTTLSNMATNAYDATLFGGASIINDVPSPASQPAAPGTGYLSMNTGSGQYVEMNQPISLNTSGITFAFWFRWTSNVSNTPVFSFDDGTNYFIIYMWGSDWCVIGFKTPSGTNSGYLFNRGSYQIAIGDWVHVAFKSSTGSYYLNGVRLGSVSYDATITFFQPTRFYLGNAHSSVTLADFSAKSGTISVDNFIFYNKILTDVEIGGLYAKPTIYYTFDSDSISGGTSVGSKASGSYVYNATLVNGASIGTTNPSPAPMAGTGHLQLTSTNTIATNQYVQLTYQPTFFYSQDFFSVAFWARSNSTLGSSAKITFFDFANGIAASENANYSYSMYLQSNNIRAKISYGASGIATDDILMYTDSNILTDNVWRHYVWTIDSIYTWRLYINSILVFTKSSGFNRGYPQSSVTYNNCFIGRDAGSWQTASFSGAIDEFRLYSSRTLGQGEISNIYGAQVSVGKFQNPSGGSPIWISKPAIPVDSSETSYTVKSTEIALTPGEKSTYAVWTAPKTTNIKIDVSFADYHSRSTSGVGFQMFKINSDNTFGSVIFPRTVTSVARTNAASTNYLSVPSRTVSVVAGDKVVYRIDANGNTTSASSVLATNIYADNNYIPPLSSINANETKLIQAELATNMNSTTFVSGNANTVLDTIGTGNWKFYVSPTTSIESISSASNSTEWTGGSLLSGVGETFPGTLVRATFAADANSRIPGKSYLQLANPDGTLTANWQFAKFTPFSIPATGGFSFAFWFWIDTSGINRNDYIVYVAKSSNIDQIGVLLLTNNTFQIQNYNATVNNALANFPSYVMPTNTWVHIAVSIDVAGFVNLYINGGTAGGGSQYTVSNPYPTTRGLQLYYNIGVTNDGDPLYGLRRTTRIDNFKVFTTVLSDAEVLEEKNRTSSGVSAITDVATGAKWMPKPATPNDPSETNYTVKSNEIALTPGTKSTYAVWTAPKTTNVKVDVSFADCHSRSIDGVGFQMFKVNNDNTFGSVIFPRTVTSVALTDAAPTNYLSVPSRTVSVAAGDKLIYRIDANGNTTSASSVLAINIYADNNYIPPLSATNVIETKLVQAQLATNINAASFVAGNANTILDTIGTGEWKFYVSPSTSIESISSSSNSTEWTGGSIIPYVAPPGLPTDMSLCYTFNTNKVSSNTIYDSVGNLSATLVNGANIATDGSPGPGYGYLSLTKASSHYLNFGSFNVLANGLTFATWFRATSNNTKGGARIMDIRSPDEISIQIGFSDGRDGIRLYGIGGIDPFVGTVSDNVWRHLVITVEYGGVNGASSKIKCYMNGTLQNTFLNQGYPNTGTRTICNIGSAANLGGSLPACSFDGGIDDFRIYQRPITADEVSLIYSQAAMYYPFETADINGSTPTSIGEYSTGSYVYNGTLVNGATIAVDANSRISGKGYLSLTPTTYFKIVPFGIVTSGLSIAFWGRFTSSTTQNGGRIFDMRSPEIILQRGTTSFSLFVTTSSVLSSGSVFDGVWRHFVITISYAGASGASSVYKLYTNGTETATATTAYPALGSRTTYNIGSYGDTGTSGMDGGIDDFRIYQRPLSQSEVTSLYAGSSSAKITDSATGATWMPKSATPVDATETSYTVKSTEVALIPGTNSTYAIWTAPKSTNVRVDVSFADYHSRSSGVGFQMFKINSDNTFGTVIFPRTVTSAALTDAASTNYLSVPSTNFSVNTGDKVVYRIDGNGNPTSASSVLATNIYSYSGRWT